METLKTEEHSVLIFLYLLCLLVQENSNCYKYTLMDS